MRNTQLGRKSLEICQKRGGKEVLHFEEYGYIFLCFSSDEDLIFFGQASMGIKNDSLKKKRILYVRKKYL